MENSGAKQRLSCIKFQYKRRLVIKTHSRKLRYFRCQSRLVIKKSLEKARFFRCQSILVIKKSLEKARSKSLAENIGKCYLNVDTLINVLSLLPIESVPEIKLVCKWWYYLTRCHSFRKAHFQNWGNVMYGIFIQGTRACHCCDDHLDVKCVDYMGLKKKHVVKNKLDFLPEKVFITASCNGLLICRSFFHTEIYHPLHGRENTVKAELSIYVCNPLTKEFKTLKPNIMNNERCGVGLALNSLDSLSTCFEVVVVQVLRKTQSSFFYVFKIYSSETYTWRVSKEIFIYPYKLYFHRHVFVNGVFYWLTAGYSILAFDLKREKSLVIDLPDPLSASKSEAGICLGQSEGYLHYVYSSVIEFRVWVLNSDYSKPEWTLKHIRHLSPSAELVDIENESGLCWYTPDRHQSPCCNLEPHAFVDDIVYMRHHYSFKAYDLKTSELEDLYCFGDLEPTSLHNPVIIPYSRSLLPVQ